MTVSSLHLHTFHVKLAFRASFPGAAGDVTAHDVPLVQLQGRGLRLDQLRAWPSRAGGRPSTCRHGGFSGRGSPVWLLHRLLHHDRDVSSCAGAGSLDSRNQGRAGRWGAGTAQGASGSGGRGSGSFGGGGGRGSPGQDARMQAVLASYTPEELRAALDLPPPAPPPVELHRAPVQSGRSGGAARVDLGPMRPIHLAAAISRVPKLRTGPQQQQQQQQQQGMEKAEVMAELLPLAAGQARALTARQLANVLWAAARVLGRQQQQQQQQGHQKQLHRRGDAAADGTCVEGANGLGEPSVRAAVEALLSEAVGQQVELLPGVGSNSNSNNNSSGSSSSSSSSSSEISSSNSSTGPIKAGGSGYASLGTTCKLQGAGGRELANFAWAAAQLGVAAPAVWGCVRRLVRDRLLAEEVEDEAQGRAGQAQEQRLHRSGWQQGGRQQQHGWHQQRQQQQQQQQGDHLNAADLANFAWALARVQEAAGAGGVGDVGDGDVGGGGHAGLPPQGEAAAANRNLHSRSGSDSGPGSDSGLGLGSGSGPALEELLVRAALRRPLQVRLCGVWAVGGRSPRGRGVCQSTCTAPKAFPRTDTHAILGALVHV